MKPRIKKDAYTGRWQCVSSRENYFYCIGYGSTPAQAYEDWARQ